MDRRRPSRRQPRAATERPPPTQRRGGTDGGGEDGPGGGGPDGRGGGDATVTRRRALLAGVGVAGATGLAGCAGLRGLFGGDAAADGAATARTSATSTPSLSGPSVSQSVTLGNTNRSAAYVTVAVSRGSRTAFVRSVELLPGEQVRFPDAVAVGGAYDVVVETAGGARREVRWTVDDRLDGISVLLEDGVAVWPTLRCLDPVDCALARGGEARDVPLVGDGSARWYAPAAVHLRNPGDDGRAVDLRVALDGRTLVDAAYALPGGTRLELPLTYRSGTYDVTATVGGETVESTWPVPQVPQRYVTVGAGASFGCGPANTVVRVANRDDTAVAVDLVVRDPDGTVRHEETVALAAGTTTEVEPVTASGEYRVTATTDAGASTTDAWWACPPHGPVEVLVDATGTVQISQGFDGGRV